MANTDRTADDAGTVKNEATAMASSPPYKYVVASDSRYTENISELNHINGYVESAQHINTAAADAGCEQTLVYHANAVDHHSEHHAQYSYIDGDYMHHSRDKHGRSDTEIVLQDANGQLYRHVHNVYVNHGDAINSVELMPTLISEAMDNGIGYATHETYDPSNVAYEMHAANIDGALSTAAGEKQVHHGSGSDDIMQRNTVDLIYDNYKEQTQQYTMLESINQNNVIRDGGGGMHQNGTTTNYQSKCSMEKDQQRILLESTMSPLCKLAEVC